MAEFESMKWMSLGVALALSGCVGNPSGLVLDLRSDYLAGVEVTHVETAVRPSGSLGSASLQRIELGPDDDLLDGVRIFEDAVATGVWEASVVLRAASGQVVAQRRVIVDVPAGHVIGATIVVTANCRGFECGALECQDRMCVDPSCTPENPDACPADSCATDADCSLGPSCVSGRCRAGTCFAIADDLACEPEEWCDRGSGCVPAPSAPLTGVVAVALGDRHACAQVSGTVRCWGDNSLGQLGLVGGGDRLLPAEAILRGVPVDAMSAGDDHTCVSTEGMARCWGASNRGESGNLVPMVFNPSRVDEALLAAPLSSGGRHTCMLGAGCGDSCPVYCWGDNRARQQGSVLRSYGALPVIMEGTPGDVRAIAAGDRHTCVSTPLDVYCVGNNSEGQLGTSAPESTETLTRSFALADIELMEAGFAHTCAVSAGRVQCWGDNERGQVDGVPSAGGVRAPRDADVPGVVVDLGVGARHSCALNDGGEIYCWGDDTDGQCGGPSGTGGPQRVDSVPSAVAVAAGGAFTCAVTGEGAVQCWGDNDEGQLGDGSREGRAVARPVQQ